MSGYPEGIGKSNVFAVAHATIDRTRSASGQRWAVACFYDDEHTARIGAARLLSHDPETAAIVVRLNYSGCATQVESFGLDGVPGAECAYQGLFKWPDYARSWSLWEAAARFAIQDIDDVAGESTVRLKSDQSSRPAWLLAWIEGGFVKAFYCDGRSDLDKEVATRFATEQAARDFRHPSLPPGRYTPAREDQV